MQLCYDNQNILMEYLKRYDSDSVHCYMQPDDNRYINFGLSNNYRYDTSYNHLLLPGAGRLKQKIHCELEMMRVTIPGLLNGRIYSLQEYSIHYDLDWMSSYNLNCDNQNNLLLFLHNLTDDIANTQQICEHLRE